ncbi:preprotein translocase subunit SecE [Candidatus Parcubacteria bacterium]|nr:preprotein translocase subunit SecE [Candidatus Parcubacteria bacterium]
MNVKEFPQKIIIFLNEVKTEMKKVNWPTNKETLNYTLIVVVVCLAVAAFLGGLDYIFTTLLNKYIL